MHVPRAHNMLLVLVLLLFVTTSSTTARPTSSDPDPDMIPPSEAEIARDRALVDSIYERYTQLTEDEQLEFAMCVERMISADRDQGKDQSDDYVADIERANERALACMNEVWARRQGRLRKTPQQQQQQQQQQRRRFSSSRQDENEEQEEENNDKGLGRNDNMFEWAKDVGRSVGAKGSTVWGGLQRATGRGVGLGGGALARAGMLS